jgi:hypothetical protein
MATRCLLASSCAAIALVIWGGPATCVAQSPAGRTPHVSAGLVPDDAFAVIDLYPRRVLTDPALAKFKLDDVLGDLRKGIRFSPIDLDEMVLLAGPPMLASRGSVPLPYFAMICRFATAQDGESPAAKWLPRAEQIDVAGHKCFRTAGAFSEMPTALVTTMLDDHTFVVASQAWLPKILAAKDAKSTLITALAAKGDSADATLIFSNTDIAKELISKFIPPASELPPTLQPVAPLQDLLRAAKLSIYTKPEVSLKLILVADDADSAGKVAAIVTHLQELGKLMIPYFGAQPGETRPNSRAIQQFSGDLGTIIVNGLTPTQFGNKVVVEINGFGKPEDMVGKVIGPIRSIRNSNAALANLKMLGLYFENYEYAYGRFPAHAIYSKDGKPLLSWRVSILQYLDKKLYGQFHLDEPWDSEHNKPLLARMPKTFEVPGDSLGPGMTRFLVPVGEGTIFEGKDGIKAAEITDGLSKTIMVVEVAPDKAVPWTKPDDIDFNPEKPFDGLGSMESGITAVFADDHTQVFHHLDADTFRWLVLRADGHPISVGRLP